MVKCASIGKTKEWFEFSEEPQQQQQQRSWLLLCSCRLESPQTPPPPASETQHGSRPDGNKQRFDKYLKERKTLMKKTFKLDKQSSQQEKVILTDSVMYALSYRYTMAILEYLFSLLGVLSTKGKIIVLQQCLLFCAKSDNSVKTQEQTSSSQKRIKGRWMDNQSNRHGKLYGSQKSFSSHAHF